MTLDVSANVPSDASPVEGVLRREWARLFKFIRKRVGTESDAEDLLQDVFYQLISSYSVTEPVEDWTAWLFAVARNKIVDWYRRRRPRVETTTTAERAPVDAAVTHTDSPEFASWRSAVWSELEDALEDLPPAQREVFVAHEFEGLSFKEIAERTGEPLNTLLSRKRYAVLFLRERLRELYDELDG